VDIKSKPQKVFFDVVINNQLIHHFGAIERLLLFHSQWIAGSGFGG
jgi:hypothetical protein